MVRSVALDWSPHKNGRKTEPRRLGSDARWQRSGTPVALPCGRGSEWGIGFGGRFAIEYGGILANVAGDSNIAGASRMP